MSRRLASTGVPLTLWNRGGDRAAALATELGARSASSPADAVHDVDVAITTLADGQAVEQVYLGPQGIVAGARDGLVACEMSTIEPQVSTRIAARMQLAGGHLLDSPVSGSVSLAEQGALTLMVGGDPAAVERVRPVLDILGKDVVLMGGSGTGAVMKLAVNSVLHGLNEALAEALVLAERAGIDRERAYDVFQRSAAGAPFVQYKRDAYLHPEIAAVAFRLALARKDVRLILDLADSLDVVMAQGRTNLEVLEDAMDRHGDQDMSALAVHLRELAQPAGSPTNRTEIS